MLVLFSNDDPDELSVFDNLCEALSFAKVAYVAIDIRQAARIPDFARFSAIAITASDTSCMSDGLVAILKQRSSEGAGIAALCPVRDRRLNEVFGLRTLPQAGAESSGLRFNAEIIRGISGLNVGDDDWHFAHQRLEIGEADLESGAAVFAHDFDGNPLGWSVAKGQGRAVYWNTLALGSRALRGILLMSVVQSARVSASALAGIAMFHVDDFPPSLSDQVQEPVSEEFGGMSRSDFFFRIWYPDILALLAKHGLRITWYSVIDYDDVANETRPDPTSAALVSGKRILEERFRLLGAVPDGDEYGFHGYNHDPLIATSWPDTDILREKLEHARDLWRRCVPAPLPASWVAANNWYHPEHLRVLRSVFPEITTVCSLFSLGEFELGEYREVGREPWAPDMMQIPRETYGYINRPETLLMLYSQAAWMGSWTHFIHPDDVYDVPGKNGDPSYCRNEKRRYWKRENAQGRAGLLSALDEWLCDIRRLFPWLTFMTTARAAEKLQQHGDNQATIFTTPDMIRIESSLGGLFAVNTPSGTRLHPRQGSTIVNTCDLAWCNQTIVEVDAGCGSCAIIRDSAVAPERAG